MPDIASAAAFSLPGTFCIFKEYRYIYSGHITCQAMGYFCKYVDAELFVNTLTPNK